MDSVYDISMSFKIGVFDSGIGGFSILSKLIQNYPEGEYYYISDAPHAPYGPKEPQFIIERSRDISQQLIDQGCHLIVVACNTATSLAIDLLRTEFNVPFIGVEPYLNSKHHLNLEGKKMVGLMTKATSSSDKFKKLKQKIDPEEHITIHACLQLASLVEMAFARECLTDDLVQEIHRELAPLKNGQFTHAILGCTHYSLVDSVIKNYLNVETLSPSEGVGKRLIQLLGLPKTEIKPLEHWRDVSFHFRLSNQQEWQQRPLSTTILSLAQ